MRFRRTKDYSGQPTKRYRYEVRDAKDGKIFLDGEIHAASRTHAREVLMDNARRDTPGGRGRSPRDYGYVPVSDYRIRFTHEDGERL